ncbi:MAG TPA: hypothetical protein VFW11_19920 [Cyclobacteriaceae bacterium]|nr:hypothetical protein [Cyclobacteriaceae bacterium]
MSFIPKPDEFYIGYLPKAPDKTARIVTRTVFTLVLLILLVCTLVVLNQRKFSSGTFEYGQLTVIEGIFSESPVPNLRVNDGGKSKMILLVGFGKMGAMPTITTLEEKSGKNFNGQYVELKGTRIYDHEKELMQITVEDNLEVEVGSIPENFPPVITKSLGTHSFLGEIVDPKCFLGVMKPAEGKPHRSCAIRCIAGGIPPIFSIRNSDVDFVILTGEKINAEIIPLVGDPVELQGDVIQIDNWKVMNVNMDNVRFQAKRKTKENLIAFEEDITLCMNR